MRGRRVIADGGGSRYQIESRVRRDRATRKRRWRIWPYGEPVAGRDVLVGEHSVLRIATTSIDRSDCLHSVDNATMSLSFPLSDSFPRDRLTTSRGEGGTGDCPHLASNRRHTVIGNAEGVRIAVWPGPEE